MASSASSSSAAGSQPQTPQLVSRRGTQCYEEGTRVWMVSTVAKRGMALAEVYRVQPTEGGTVVHLRAVEAVNGVREPFQKVVPLNQTHTPPHQQQGSDGDGRLFRCIHRVGTAVSSAETNSESQHSKAVCVGDGNKRARVAGGPAGCSGVEDSAAAGDKEKRQRIETICSLVMECLPLHVLIPLSQRLAKSTKQMWEQAAPSHTRLFIDWATKDDEHCWRSPTEGRTFWQRIPLDLVKRMAARLTGLTHIALCHPEHEPMWCTDVLVTIIETTAAPPSPSQPPPATDQPGTQGEAPQRPSEVRPSASRLETIAFEEVRMSEAEEREVERRSLPLPPRLTEAPTFPSLKAVTGAVGDHGVLADRGWRMPSLERLEQQGWYTGELGRFVSSSRSLQHISGDLQYAPSHLLGEQWAAAVFEHIPKAAAGQPVPLSQLQSIGTIQLAGDVDEAGAAVDRLQAALTSRGCRRSLTQLVVEMSFLVRTYPPFRRQLIDSRVFPLLESVESLHKSCCRPDANVIFEADPNVHQSFDLSLFYSDDFPPNPSPLFKSAIQAAARKARRVVYVISQHDLTHPVDSPSPAAIDIAKTLTFDSVNELSVCNADGFVPPPNTPSPRPAIIDHLQPFPTARQLQVLSSVGGATARLLAEKMPKKVESLWFDSALSADERRNVLEALGTEGEMETVTVARPFRWQGSSFHWYAVSLTDGAFDGWSSNSYPSIYNLEILVKVPDELEPSAAVERIRSGISSIVDGVRGLRSLTLVVRGSDATRAAVRQLLPIGTEVGSNFTIEKGCLSSAHRYTPQNAALIVVDTCLVNT
ncbi:unnamed protein product [Vitrella brassicaformis CCMP3155]|uniref:Uncharacterized protein n=1 Tax=Vitrella brassicaformis (strain CCMP3155) TaxID=1169540 RepID=A0A0G4EHT1_VITBC|nr:unnamed protein product [Vitrella brassicaformis CCMP3155]|eukprot:CEL95750.1 unnamed protein product [Vitrella brassicaformis CCMP3155]